MKEYNFDENKSMGETVRIDDIKMRLNEMGEQGENYEDGFDEYGGYDEDDDDFDDDYDYDDNGDIFGDTAEVPGRGEKTVRRQSRPAEKPEQKHKGGRRQKNGPGKWLYIVIAAAMVVFVFAAVYFVSGMNGRNDEEQEAPLADESFYGVVVSVSGDSFEILNTADGKTLFYTIGSGVPITKEDGRMMAYTAIARGDIILIGVAGENKSVVSVEYTDDVWEKEDFTNIELDTAQRTISNGVSTYDYDKSTLFIYNGGFISAEEMDKTDVVTLKGVGDKVWTVTVEKYHGYIKLENVDKIEDAVITVDGEEIEFTDNQAAVSSGAHTLGISGSNIEELTVDIHITAGEVYSVDMASVQEKTGVLTLNVNVDDCIIVVDGKQVNKDEPVVLSLGTYPISVSAEGYKTYSGTVEINEPLVEVNIELEKIEVKTATITVDSTPSGATVYANGAVIGVTPFTTQINYGDYRITFEKDGYMDYNVDTSVNEETKTISVLLTED